MPEGGHDVRRVLMVSSLWPPVVLGGAETYAADLAAHLRDRGVAVAVVTSGVDGPDVVDAVPTVGYRLDQYAAQPRARRARFHAADLYRWSVTHDIAAAIAHFEPDVVHTHAVAGLSSAALAAPTRVSTAHVHTIHDYWLLCQRSTMTRNGEMCAGRCMSCVAISLVRNCIIARHPPDVVLAVSRAVTDAHAGVGWLRDRMRVLHNPVARVERVKPSPRVSRNPVVFGYLGRLTVTKGVRTLVRAFTAAAIPETRLEIAGTGPLVHELIGDAPERVRLVGWLDAKDKSRWLDDIDCLVVPSEWRDPAPLVVDEARARGVPVIGARVGGIPEGIAPECAPLMFAPGDTEELATRLREFAAHRTKYVPDVPHGNDAAVLDWDQHVDGVLCAYRDASRARGAGTRSGTAVAS